MNKKSAFTLIELIITLSIIVILLSIVRINFMHSRKSLALEELAIISESITNARSYSISSGRDVKIISSKSENSIKIKSNNYYFKDIKCKYLEVTNSLTLIFNKNGIPEKADSFLFSYKNSNYKISVRPATGFVNVVEE